MSTPGRRLVHLRNCGAKATAALVLTLAHGCSSPTPTTSILATTTVMRTSVVESIDVRGTLLTKGGRSINGGEGVVTIVESNVGTSVQEGSVLLWINARPIVGVNSSEVFWRELRFDPSVPPQAGRDVGALTGFLERNGFAVRTPSQFDLDASDKLAAYQRSIGFDSGDGTLRVGELVNVGGGAVIERTVQAGTHVDAETEMLRLKGNRPVLEISLTPNQRSRIGDDDEVTFVPPGTDAVTAKLTSVDEMPSTDTDGKISYGASADLPRSYAPEATEVKATIELTRRDDVLTVPAAVISYDDRNRAGVWVPIGDGVRFQPVTTGLSGNGLIEVIDGLKDGDSVAYVDTTVG